MANYESGHARRERLSIASRTPVFERVPEERIRPVAPLYLSPSAVLDRTIMLGVDGGGNGRAGVAAFFTILGFIIAGAVYLWLGAAIQWVALGLLGYYVLLALLALGTDTFDN